MSLLVIALSLFTLGVGSAFAQAGAPVSDSGIVPIFVDGNPSCTSLGYAFGYKVDPPNSGTYPIDGFNTVTVTTDGVYFDWESTLGMDAVIAKGGPNANSYVYDPPTESFGDGGLASPINPSNGNPYGLSHIEFCYDYELTVAKTADTSYTRTFQWTIEKSVTPETLDMFTGDSDTVEYEIVVTKDAGTDSDWAVQGTITIENNTPFDATITSVSDVISGFGAVAADCGVSFPYNLASGGTLNCTYDTPLPNGDSRTNEATVTTSGAVGGGSDTAPVVFGDPTTVVNDSINVDDSNGGSWPFSDDGSVTYNRTFTCDGDEGTHNNTATIRETGQADSASVVVNCYELSVTKNADTSLTRTWTWTIEKSADTETLTLATGQTYLVNYTVSVSALSADSDWAVEGKIWVENPAPIDATLNTVADVLSDGTIASVDCGVTFPYTLLAGGTLECTYNADLSDASTLLNTATATLQNTPSGTTDFTGSASVDFSQATVSQVDECIDVVDDQYGILGTVCASELPKTFTYSMEVGPYSTCGQYEFTNVASFTTNDTGATDNDDHTVYINVPCLGCTLTPGYWKTHSAYGPARYDDAWMMLGDADGDGISEGQDETFFLSGKTYYQVLWTPPNGNAYYILAHAYIAAKLNIMNGAASTPQVNAAITFAETFFAAKTPSSSLTKAQRNTVIANAQILDKYNNGLIGPGHCTE